MNRIEIEQQIALVEWQIKKAKAERDFFVVDALAPALDYWNKGLRRIIQAESEAENIASGN